MPCPRHKLPPLLPGWHWGKMPDTNDNWVASFFSTEIDCYVSIDKGSITISTGTAPYEIVAAVIKANT